MRVKVTSLSVIAVIAATPAWGEMLGRNKSDCRIIEEAARTNLLRVSLLTRLLWTESRFQADALSPKGALGVAQFMPGTADERGLSNPFDPKQAIPQAARLLADLDRRFSNTGLAVAAYNAGNKRVSDWLANSQPLPKETQNFVLAVTGHSPSEWSTIGGYLLTVETQSCLALSTSLAAHPFNNPEGPVYRGFRSPYSGSSGPPYPYGSNSQYYVGYQKSGGLRYPFGSNSQYYIGYSNSDGANGDGDVPR
jgi:Transglycosylase SLT domain